MQNNQDKENHVKEMPCYGLKLQNCVKRYEELEMRIYDVNRSKMKASVEIEEMEKRKEILQERLKGIHDNYMSCVKKINNAQREGEVYAKIEKLTAERDDLRERLAECKRLDNANEERINKLIMMINIEKKKNAALARKLDKASRLKNIPQNLRDKINAILSNQSVDEA